MARSKLARFELPLDFWIARHATAHLIAIATEVYHDDGEYWDE
jgi:hypothetical protein